MTGAPARRVEILMVDDDPGDVAYTRDVFAEYRVCNELVVIGDPALAMAYLRRLPPYPAAHRPDVVLLNLNLPGVGGRAVLDAVLADGALRDIPVVLLTASEAEAGMLRDTGLPVAWYLTKPFDFDRLDELVRHLDHCYLQVERAPAGHGGPAGVPADRTDRPA